MHKGRRLTRAKDFAAIRREGRSWSDAALVLLARRNSLEVSRVGFSVGRRIGNAVMRNRTKRRLREVVRAAALEGGWDLVLIARKGAASVDFRSLRRSVTRLLMRAGVLETSPRPVSTSCKAN